MNEWIKKIGIIFSIKTYVVGINLMHLGEAKTCNEYSFEEPWWGSSNEYPQLMFLWREKNTIIKYISWTIPLYVLFSKQDLTFHEYCLQWRLFAWSVKSYFLDKQ